VGPDISSPANERIKWLVRLRNRRYRDDEGVFVVEGVGLYRKALAAGLVPEVTFVSDDSIESTGPTLLTEPEALDRASYRQKSQGLIAVFPQLDTGLHRLELAGDDPLILVAESIEKPGNLGAILRTVGAAGADALITVGEGPDAHNPNVVRASTGALFAVRLAVSDWDELQPWLDDRGIRAIATSPAATTSIWDADLTGPVALITGAEAEGLSPRAVDVAAETLLIPQSIDTVDSLNVSVAAAILLYEARRQRSQAGR
jgi:TrmH family RNA methyltransferase